MLGKLMKHEIKVTSKTMIPIYLVLIMMAAVLKILVYIEKVSPSLGDSLVLSLVELISLIMFGIAVIFLFFGTMIVIVKRFYDNMLKEEGYLSLTLPVGIGTHIANKVIVSFWWIVASMAVFLISIGILMYGDGFVAITEFIKTTEKMLSESHTWGLAIKTFAILFIGIYKYILIAFACLCIGQLFLKHRIVGAIISFFVIYMLEQMAGMVFLVKNVFVSGTSSGMTSAGIESELQNSVNAVAESATTFGLVMAIVEVVLFTGITYYILKRKLNLE